MEKTSKILFTLLLLFLSTVVLVSYFHTKQLTELRGTFKKIDRPIFSWSNWLNGDFQKQMDKRTNYRFFLRSPLIKMRNQIDYDLFDKVNADIVIKGKEDILFSEQYIHSYLGVNFIGKDSIEATLDRLEFIQDTLTQMDKKFLIVIGPSKASYFPDHFPEKYNSIEKSLSNYDYYVQELKDRNINHIDFNRIFIDIKDTVQYPLYSKQGIHWNNYSRKLAWNMITDNLERDTGWKLAKLKSTDIELLPPKGRDLDLYHLLNIYSSIDTSKLAYQDYTIDTTGIDRPKGIVIADSYFWGLRTLGFSKEVLNDGMYWYYNNTIYPAKNKILYTPEDYHKRFAVLDHDIVILLATSANLDKFPFGFDKEFYEALQEEPSLDHRVEKEIDRMVKRIENNKQWYGDLKKQSVEKGESLDSLLHVAADYFLKQERKKK